MISIDDFKKVEIKIGHIMSVEKVSGSEKLLKLSVDFGKKENSEEDIRQVISGIGMFYEDCQELSGKKCAFVTNLEPRMIMGLESQGMILAVNGDNFFSLLETTPNVIAGSTIK